MKNAVLKAIRDFSLLGDYQGATVTVALSGGADSMSLLHILLSLESDLGITVEAAHFNHLIRGEEALRDEEFVKNQCRNLGVKLYLGQEDVPAFAKEKGISLETAARELRYEFLSRINKDFIATAHTASDNLETVLFNLARGSAIDGLCGIPPKRDIFIRPLILSTREKVEKYCEINNIPFVTDSTNLSDDYSRNKIRHKIVPILKEINPSIENTVGRMAVSLKEDSEYLKAEATDFLSANLTEKGELDLKKFDTLNRPIATRVIKQFIENAGVSPEAVHINAVLAITKSQGKISLPRKMNAVSEAGILKIVPCGEDAQKESGYLVNITESDCDFFDNTKNVNNLLLKNSIDCDKIIGKSVLRTRLSGDSIRLKNRGCTKSLNKIYNESKIPAEERDKLPVIADDKGVIWIYGIGVAHRCAVDKNTKRVLIINSKKS